MPIYGTSQHFRCVYVYLPNRIDRSPLTSIRAPEHDFVALACVLCEVAACGGLQTQTLAQYLSCRFPDVEGWAMCAGVKWSVGLCTFPDVEARASRALLLSQKRYELVVLIEKRKLGRARSHEQPVERRRKNSDGSRDDDTVAGLCPLQREITTC